MTIGWAMDGAALRRVALALAISASAPFAARAEETATAAYKLEIPRAKADIALKTLAKMTGHSLLFNHRDVAEIDVNALSGTFTLEGALQAMLKGTRLFGTLTEGGVITISLRPPPDVAARDGGKVESAPQGKRLGGASSLVRSIFGGDEAEEDRGRRDAAFAIDEVTVTARKVAENLQDTPVSITAHSGATLERRQIFNAADIDQITPNLQFATNAPLAGNNSASQIFIRGIGQTDPTAVVDPGVGLYIDDVYMGQSVGGAIDFRDVQSVQVLRGPQGALFGRNTIGGAILLTTNKPGDEWGGTVRFAIGSDRLREAWVALDAPVSDRLSTRFTFGARNRKGYVTRLVDGLDLGDDDGYTMTGKAVWTPSPGLAFTFKADYASERENGSPLVFAAIAETAVFPRTVSFAAGCPGMASADTPVPAIDDPRCANDFWAAGPFANSGALPLKSNLENWGLALTGQWDVTEELSLKSITSYRQLAWQGNRDADNTPFLILHTVYDSDGDQFSQEFQATYQSSRATGVVGLYYFAERIDDDLAASFSPPPFPAGKTDSNDNIIDNDNWAVFAQWTFRLDAAMSVTGGVRYTEESKGIVPHQYGYENPANLYVDNRLFERRFSAVTGSAAIQYRWSDSMMTYAGWSQGFKSGGFNGRFNNPQANLAPPPFDDERAETYELGAKLDLGKNLRINMAAFHTDYTDLQLTYRVGHAPYIFNAGRARIQGFEMEFQFLPLPYLSIEGGFGHLNDKIKEVDAIPGATTAVTPASALPYTPNWQGNFGAAYSFFPSKGIEITPRLDVIYTGRQFFDSGNTLEISQTGGVTLVNAAIAVHNPNGAWRFSFGVNNLGDKSYPVAGNSSLTTSAGYAEIAYSRGREWHVGLTKDF